MHIKRNCQTVFYIRNDLQAGLVSFGLETVLRPIIVCKATIL